MKKLVLTLFLSGTMLTSLFANCHSLGNAAYEAAIAQGNTEEAAAAIANAVIDACEGGLNVAKR